MTNLSDITLRQNEVGSIALLKAADAAHAYARRSELARALITLISLGMAILASVRTDWAPALALVGVLATAVSELLRSLLSLPWTKTATLLQERFDTRLFGLPWKQSIGRNPRDEEVHHWARRFKGDPNRVENWYIDVAGLPRGHAVLLCQRQNLSWDARLRGMWAKTLLIAVFGWLGAGLVIGFIGDWRVTDLVVRWLAPSLPALALASRNAWSQRQIAVEKESLIDRIEMLLQSVPVGSVNAHERLLHVAREVQDELARLRSDETRVPEFLYRWFRKEDEEAAAVAAQGWRDRLLRDTSR